MRLKQAIYESTRAPLRGLPFPIGKAKRRGLRRPKRKPTPPRCVRQPLPREGARVDTPSLLPMEGGAPKGRRLDGGSGMKKIGGDRLKYAVYESTRAPLRGPPSQWGRLRYEDAAFLASSKRIQDTCRKRITTDKAFPSRGRWRAERAG